jgi:hypothetical protein
VNGRDEGAGRHVARFLDGDGGLDVAVIEKD